MTKTFDPTIYSLHPLSSNTVNKIKQHVTSNSAPLTDYCNLTDLTDLKMDDENSSRKVSTESDYTSVSSDYTPDNTIINDDENFVVVKPVPVRKISRFLVSPAALIAANEQHIENHTEIDLTDCTAKVQQRPAENVNTLEQLKIELENITHAHVPTAKTKEFISETVQQHQHQLDTNIDSSITESLPGSMSQDTSVYNSRRTSTDYCSEPVITEHNLEAQRKLSQQGSLDR